MLTPVENDLRHATGALRQDNPTARNTGHTTCAISRKARRPTKRLRELILSRRVAQPFESCLAAAEVAKCTFEERHHFVLGPLGGTRRAWFELEPVVAVVWFAVVEPAGGNDRGDAVGERRACSAGPLALDHSWGMLGRTVVPAWPAERWRTCGHPMSMRRRSRGWRMGTRPVSAVTPVDVGQTFLIWPVAPCSTGSDYCNRPMSAVPVH